MNIHKNARLTVHGRVRLVEIVGSGETIASASRHSGVSPKTVRKWLQRYQRGGLSGLNDRSSRPHHINRSTPQSVVDRIIRLRRQRWTGQHIAQTVGVSPATVSRVLKRAGLSRLKDLEPTEPVTRYERAHAGELIHLDIKKLGRFKKIGHRITGDRCRQSSRRTQRCGKSVGAGWESVHVCIDDHSRLAYTEIFADEKAPSATACLINAVAWYQQHGITVIRVMTDNGPCYRSTRFKQACQRLKLRHIRTRPYTPKTNGKAERFIQTALREWAYARAYQNSDQRADYLPLWTHMYNWHRPHGGIGNKTPISRLGLTENNLLRHHI